MNVKERVKQTMKLKDVTGADLITKEEFDAFQKVYEYGRWNMFNDMARKSTGLDTETYFRIIAFYKELKAKYYKK